MPVAVRMAVEREVVNEDVLLHTFQFLSFCAPGPIPLEVVVKFVATRMPDLDEEDIIGKIMQSSLVQMSCNKDGEQTLWLHQVLYRIIRSNTKVCIQPENEIEVISAALSPIQCLTVDDRSTSKIFVEHLNAFLSYVISISLELSSTDFYTRLLEVIPLADFFECFVSCASMCHKYGKMSTVEQCIQMAVRVIEGSVSVDEKTSSLLHFFCGSALIDLSEYVRAIEYLETSLVMRRRIYGNRHKAVAECLRHLGRVSFNFSRNEDATKFFHEALFIFREIRGEKSGEVAECLVGLGNVKGNLRYHDEATRYFQDALSISRELFGTKHLIVARCLHNLGVTSIDCGRYDDAGRFLEEALAIQLEICGEKQEQVAISLTNLGRLHLKCSRFETARHFMERALNIRRDIGNQLRVGRSLYHLGSLIEKEGKINTAADYYSRALETIRRYEFLPENHLYVREAVEALRRLKEATDAQSTTANNIPLSTKRKADDLASNIKLQHPRKVIKC